MNLSSHTPARRPLPTVSATPPTFSPSYGIARIVGLETDPLTKHENYKVVKPAGAYISGTHLVHVAPRHILKHVSASELENFECQLAHDRSEREKADRRARLTPAKRRGPGRPPKHAAHRDRAVDSPAAADDEDVEVVVVGRKRSPRDAGFSESRSRSKSARFMDVASRSRTSSEQAHGSLASQGSLSPSRRRIRDSRASSAAKESPASSKGKGKAPLDPPLLEPSPSAEASSEEEEEVYEVEEILADKLVDGERVYIVKWVGFDGTTEEPTENLLDAQEAVGEYWAAKARD